MGKNSIAADLLRARRNTLSRRGEEIAPVLDARLQFTEAEAIGKYLRMMDGQESIRPHMLPTAQANARWSTTDPPLPGFPRKLADGKTPFPRTIIPWPGTYWVKFDLSAIEARIAAAYAKDQEDLDIFHHGYDLHTMTACQAIYHQPLPPDLVNPHTAPSCEAWRAAWSPPWSGKEDLRRVISKNTRYGTLYSYDRTGKSILGQKDVERSGLDRETLVEAARKFIAYKRDLWICKLKVAEQCIRTGVVYSFLGHRRRLYGDDSMKRKLGWNTMVSASVSDMMNWFFIQIDKTFPKSRIIVNCHDGAEIEFPQDIPTAEAVAGLKAIVERPWDIDRRLIVSKADWKLITDQSVTSV